MDAKRFDDLTRVLAKTPSRRSALKGIVAATAGFVGAAVGSQAEAAFRCRAKGVVCSKNADCCGKLCSPMDKTGRRYCACDAGQINCSGVCCGSDVACNPDGGCCTGTGAVPAGGLCQTGTDCCNGSCNYYAGRCYERCVPAGSPTNSAYGCCSFNVGYFSGNTIICADQCVANGLKPADYLNGGGTCCSQFLDVDNLCALQND